MEPTRFAVVGLNMGRSHIHRTILGNPRADLTACCDLDEGLLRETRAFVAECGKNPDDVVYTREFDDVIRMGNVDAVSVVVPTPVHADFTVRALEAGKHVMCEKPLCDTLEAADRMCEAAEASDRVFQLAYCVRSSAFNRKCLELTRNGAIGDAVLVWWNMFTTAARDGWRGDRRLQGGKLFDCACHYFDILGLWAGAPASRVCAFGTGKGETGANADKLPQIANIIVEYENGVKGTYNLSALTPNLQNSTCGIAGTRGKIEGDPYYPEGAGSLVVHSDDGLFRHTIEINAQKASAGHLGFGEQYEVFLDAIEKGTPVACTAEEGREVLRLMLAIDRSIATGEVVKVEDVC